jgi:hypothetical protein
MAKLSAVRIRMSVSVQISAISIVLDPLAQSDVGRNNKDIITETSMFTKPRPSPAGPSMVGSEAAAM